MLLSALICLIIPSLLIEEPPGRSELNLSAAVAIIEIMGGHHFIIGRVEVVQDGLCQLIRAVEPAAGNFASFPC